MDFNTYLIVMYSYMLLFFKFLFGAVQNIEYYTIMGLVNTDIIIIGGGLTGLTLSYLLGKNHIDHVVVEARNRLGGRIHTINKVDLPPLEMGATWIHAHHRALLNLMDELELPFFKQVFGDHAIYEVYPNRAPQLVPLPTNEAPSYRVEGGTDQIIHKLASYSDPSDIFLNENITKITKAGDVMDVTSDQNSFVGKRVVSTLPPMLFVNSIDVEPALPSSLLELCAKTHTWMGESIKIGLGYKDRFWTKEKLSGTIFSKIGPIPEMFDHSNKQETLFALVGFLNSAYFQVDKEKRLQLILNQLQKYFGSQAFEYTHYEELIWRKEPCTYFDSPDLLHPHQNNGHPLYQQAFLDNGLFIAGSETSPHAGGYMEGAIRSARHIFALLESQKN